MALQVEELHESPKHKQKHYVGFVLGNFLGKEEELEAIHECEQNPIVGWVDEEPFEGHRLPTENMDEDGFQFPFEEVRDRHDGC